MNFEIKIFIFIFKLEDMQIFLFFFFSFSVFSFLSHSKQDERINANICLIFPIFFSYERCLIAHVNIWRCRIRNSNVFLLFSFLRRWLNKLYNNLFFYKRNNYLLLLMCKRIFRQNIICYFFLIPQSCNEKMFIFSCQDIL